ncbi:MAG: EAL domain-containing protein [Steroidobacteraceae bacterium]
MSRLASLSLLRSRVARNLFAVLAVCVLLPLGASMTLGYAELDASLEARSSEQLRTSAKAVGLETLSRLHSADQMLRALAALPVGAVSEAVSQQPYSPVFDGIRTNLRSADSATLSRRPDGAGDFSRLTVDQSAGSVALWLSRSRDDGSVISARVRNDHLLAGLGEYANGAHFAIELPGQVRLAESGPPDWLSDVATRLRQVPSGAGGTFKQLRFRPPSDAEEQMLASWTCFMRSAFVADDWNILVWDSPATVAQVLRRGQILFPAIAACGLFLALLYGLREIRRRLEPLDELTRAIATFETEQRVIVPRIAAGDEFARLAAAFTRMSLKLQSQLESMQEMARIDRILLDSDGLESVIDALLPCIAKQLRADAVSLVMLDDVTPTLARVFDQGSGATEGLRVRRVALSAQIQSYLRDLVCGQAGSCATLDLKHAADVFLGGPCDGSLRIWPIVIKDQIEAVLVAAVGEGVADAQQDVRAQALTDRIAVVLNKLARDREIIRSANYDTLTALPNRRMFVEQLERLLNDARQGAAHGAVLFIDVDRFKQVNDTQGHAAGDRLLKVIAERIVGVVKSVDRVARLGGDEFAVLISGRDAPATPLAVAERIRGALTPAVVIDGKEHHISVSIGIAWFPRDGTTVESLLRHADIAMYRAKDDGRGKIVQFATAMQDEMQRRARLEQLLRRAMTEGSLTLGYQPIVDCDTGRIVSAEVLLRGEKFDEAGATPLDLVTVAEECGLITQLGAWVLETALDIMVQLRCSSVTPDYISVNVSPRQLMDSSFCMTVTQALRSRNLPPSALQLEITETLFASGEDVALSLATLSELGVRIALDDFGTGFSSVSYLRNFPIHCVKIDREFIRNIADDMRAKQLVESIIAMGHALGKSIVAEGVESAQQRSILAAQGCDLVQGYLTGAPMTAAALMERLHREIELPLANTA